MCCPNSHVSAEGNKRKQEKEEKQFRKTNTSEKKIKENISFI